MYVNKCVKCGREFETKNPKRVICPDCLYPDKKMMINPSADAAGETQAVSAQNAEPEVLRSYSTEDKPQFYSSYSSGGDNRGSYNAGYSNNRPQQRQYNNDGYRRDNRAGSYNNRGGYSNNRYNNQVFAREKAAELVEKFRKENKVTCCRILSSGYEGSAKKEHCSKFVADVCSILEDLIKVEVKC